MYSTLTTKTGSSTMVRKPFPLVLFAVLFAVSLGRAAEPAGASPARTELDAEVGALVEKLSETAQIGYGYSALFSGSEFLPYSDSAQVHTLVFGGQAPERSKMLETIVRQGAAAIPVLVKHLNDGRATKIPPLRGMMWMSFADEYDYNRRTQKQAPKGVNRKTFGEKHPESHTLTVGDLCFVALGQIVNRHFNATRYQPSGGLIVNSPTYSARLLTVVRGDYADFSAAKHRQALIDDFLSPDHEDRRIGAYFRLALYYPEEVEWLVSRQLQVPTYDVFLIFDFVRKKLYLEHSPAARKTLFDAFVKANGPAFRDGILAPALFGPGQPNCGGRRAFAPAPAGKARRPSGARAVVRVRQRRDPWRWALRQHLGRFRASTLRSCVTHDKSTKIGDIVKDLFLKSASDRYAAGACLRCLASRGYADFLVAQLNKIDLGRPEADAVGTEYIDAISISVEPKVRKRLLDIVQTTANADYFMAALPAVEPKHNELVLQSARRILAALPDDTDQGEALLSMVGRQFPDRAKSIYQAFLATGNARRAETMCRVLWYGHPLAPDLLAPLLDDKRSLPGFSTPMRVCDRAAQAIENGSQELSFDEDWSTARKDSAIEQIKQYCKKAASAVRESSKGPSK